MKEECLNMLRKISLGKHSTKLYYENKKGVYSTVTGGIITLSVALVLLVTSVNILIGTFKRENYTMTTFYSDLQSSDLFETLKIGDFR
jgi:hypothetical protein